MIIDRQKDEVLKIKKELPKMPLWAMELWARNSIKAGNKGDLNILLQNPQADDARGGFVWITSEQGHLFWSRMCNNFFIDRAGVELSIIQAEVSDYLDFQHF